MPSRKLLSTRHIPQLAKEANISTRETIDQCDLVDATTDGWRKKFCEQGAPVNNGMALLPERALFHDAINVSEMRKNAEAIKQFLIGSKMSLMADSEGALDRFCAWVLENTKANWRAMIDLQEHYPQWIMRGCFAHGLEFLKPFSQAIHQLDGDRPHLSDFHVTLLQLEAHVDAWAEENKVEVVGEEEDLQGLRSFCEHFPDQVASESRRYECPSVQCCVQCGFRG